MGMGGVSAPEIEPALPALVLSHNPSCISTANKLASIFRK
jgi:hypothetical protein